MKNKISKNINALRIDKMHIMSSIDERHHELCIGYTSTINRICAFLIPKCSSGVSSCHQASAEAR